MSLDYGIPATKRIILSPDVVGLSTACTISMELRDSIWGVKLNHHFFRHGIKIVNSFWPEKIPSFIDGKFKDNPDTVSNIIDGFKDFDGIGFITLHADFNGWDEKLASLAMLQAAHKALEKAQKEYPRFQPKLLGVLTLSSVGDTASIFSQKLYGRAEIVRNAGFDGVVCASQDVSLLQHNFPKLIKVVAGCRLEGSNEHDQKRSGTPYQAIKDGGDYLVLGRDYFKAKDREAVLQEYLSQIDQGLKDRQS